VQSFERDFVAGAVPATIRESEPHSRTKFADPKSPN
jgi:hypothetical protein